jgi:hypothetical protein
MYKYKNAKKSQKSYKNIGCTKFIPNLSAMIKNVNGSPENNFCLCGDLISNMICFKISRFY